MACNAAGSVPRAWSAKVMTGRERERGREDGRESERERERDRAELEEGGNNSQQPDRVGSGAVFAKLMASPDTVIVNITVLRSVNDAGTFGGSCWRMQIEAVVSVLFYIRCVPELHMNLT